VGAAAVRGQHANTNGSRIKLVGCEDARAHDAGLLRLDVLASEEDDFLAFLL
jgi:hypothetical protein